MLASKPSTFIAWVPSCPQHSIVIFGCTPGILRSRSRPLKPTRCARRWQGAWYATGPPGVERKSVLKRGSSRISHSSSEGSRTRSASLRASGRSASGSRSGYSTRIIMAQVGLIATTFAPASTNGFSSLKLCEARRRTESRSPVSQAGMPQHCRPFTQAVLTWLWSSTSSVSRPISGSLFCT
jgi:hypothetical protein